MDEQQDLGALLGEAVTGEAAPTGDMINTEVPTEPAATDGQQAAIPEPQMQEQQQPQYDPSILEGQMNQQAAQMEQMAAQMEQMTNRIPEPQAPQASEQEMLQQQVKKDLGIDKMEARYAQQDEAMKAQQQQLAQMQEAEMIRGRESEFKSMEAEFGNIDRLAIQNKIVEMGKTNPALAEAMNSPEGVRMLLSQGVGTVAQTPDAITPSASGTDIDSSSMYNKLGTGEATDEDFGDMLLGAINS